MAQNLPTISRDCNNNLTHVSVGDTRVSFSYTTPVAFYHPSTGRVVSVNVWSQTTGRHLTAIDGGDKYAKSLRVPHDLFLRVLDLVSQGDKRSLTTAERLMNTHRGLVNSGLKAVG